MQRLKYIKWFLLGAVFFAGVAYAAPVYNTGINFLPAQNDTYDLGSTSPALEWKNVYTKNITISGTCTGCGSGAAYPFPLTGNATSTLTQFNGGLTSYASSTIGDGTQAGGLTINGGATTTGTFVVSSINGSNGTTLSLNGTANIRQTNSTAAFEVTRAGSTNGGFSIRTDGTISGSSGSVNAIGITNTVNQSGTAAYVGLLIQPTETALGSGNHWLIEAGTSTSDLFTVDNLGVATVGGAGTASGKLQLANSGASTNKPYVSSDSLGDLLLHSFSNGGIAQLGAQNSVRLGLNNTSDVFTEYARVASTGNFGISSTTPYAKLSVSGFTTGTPGIVADALSGFTGNLFDLKVASSSVFSVNQAGNLSTSISANNFVYTNPSGVLVGVASSSLNLPNTALANSAITINGSSVSLGGSITVSSTTLLANNNTWSGANVFSSAPTLGSLTGLIKGSSGVLSAAANGTDYTLITAKTCTAGDFVSAVTAAGVFTCATPTGGSSFGNPFNFVAGTPNYLIGTTSPLGLIMTASTTIGGGTQATGLTVAGGATTTLNNYLSLNSASNFTLIGTTTPFTSSNGGAQTLVVSNRTYAIGALPSISGISSAILGIAGAGSGGAADTGVGVWGFASDKTSTNDNGAYGVRADLDAGSSAQANTDAALIASVTGAGAANQYAIYSTGAKNYFASSVGVATTSPYKTLSVGGDFFVGASTAGGTVGNSIFSGTVGVASSSPWSYVSVGSGTASSSITVAEYKYSKGSNEATSTSKVLDFRTSNQIAWPLGTSATTLTLGGAVPGQTYRIVIQTPNAGTPGAITWAASSGYIISWAGGTTPTLSTTNNTMDVCSFLATQGSSTIALIGACTTGAK